MFKIITQKKGGKMSALAITLAVVFYLIVFSIYIILYTIHLNIVEHNKTINENIVQLHETIKAIFQFHTHKKENIISKN